MTDGIRTLITNDDGIDAVGLHTLARMAVDHGLEVVVAAPLTESSGTSAALSAVVEQGRVLVERRTPPDLDSVLVYGVAGSPGYIVELAALGVFGAVPQLVLSGVNRGANAGVAVVHSGTVGAALTAVGRGMRAMAVSLDVLSAAKLEVEGDRATRTAGAAIGSDTDHRRHWHTAAETAAQLLTGLLASPPGTLLNVNVPDRPPAAVRGIAAATLSPSGQVQMAIAEAGENFVRTTVTANHLDHEPGTDLALLSEGFATVTALHSVSQDTTVVLAHRTG